MDFNMDQLVDDCLKDLYNNYNDHSYNNFKNDPYYSYNNPTPTTSYDYSARYVDSTFELAMDIGSEPMRQEIPNPDIFDFMSAPSETANHTAPVEVNETNNYHVTIDTASYGSDLWPMINSSMPDYLNCWTQEGQGGHSMDDMFLTHLGVSYPDDYQKLKRIETEVAAPVEQFYLDSSYIPSGSQISSQMSPLIGLVTKPAKKYTKRSKSTTPNASSSSGVRKERSRHYCSICSKGFKDKYSVNVHIRTHTGEKPFTCSLCGKSFRQKSHLTKHHQTHMAKGKNGCLFFKPLRQF